MEQIPQSELIPTLEKVQEQFEAWRQSRAKRSAIPGVLWQAAVNLCQEHPISKISSTLRLNYAELKYRVHVFSLSHPAAPCISDSNFIELELSPSKTASECMVEMSDQKGATMRMHFKGEAGLDLLELGKAFWSRRS
jgi:hypothetical protein